MKTLKKVFFTTAIASLAFVSCNEDKPEEKVAGIVLENMDKTVKPTDDFFRHVNGTWLDKTEIPDDQTSWGGFNQLRKKTDADVLEILSVAIQEKDFPKVKDAQGNEIDSDQEKAVNYYQTIMDTIARNKQGKAPVMPYLNKVDEIITKKDVETYLTNMAPYGGGGFYGFGVFNDLKNSSQYAGYMSGGSLGLSRDYYVDDKVKDKLEKYEEFVAKMLQEFGDDEATAKKNAATIVAFEKSLAEPMMTKEESRDIRKLYNPLTVAELQKLAPAINWQAHLDGIGVTDLETVIVTDLGYFKAMSTIFTERSIEDIKLLLRWNTINSSLGSLSTDLETANWEFYSKEMRGAKKQRARDERALSSLNGAIGEALGKLYVEKMFPPEAKKKAEEMIDNVMLGFEKRIAQLPWMSEVTKEKALEKLHKLTVKIAYPDVWKDYSELQVKGLEEGGSYFENAINVTKWNYNKNMDKLGKEVDRTEWGMSPQTVNAYFNPVNNEIVFPAAILQPPFYDYRADEAVNYGGIGAVIGHEISHSFDDSGARFDGDGNLKNWWTEDDSEKFKEVGGKLVKQFSDIVAIDSLHLNGEYTLGENIGDLGGVQAAYEGLQIFLEKSGRPGKIDGYTPEQRFFLSWGTIWRTKMRDEALKNLIMTNTHSPGMYRAYMPLKNVDAFYEAFEVKEGDKMYLKPEERVRIW
ncbi:endothelin-converting protein [Polaribacter reichenbachii]|uniref:Endothelin-converting protein n=1 Tax=Polaribacter reichenbachii TaxID=996801 RepID=A0A1B8TUL4_9FLAO|nr:M13 family metallopeptidase [Polaribacter reichenbachii]APZ45750.1 endothelin-converting protein [Polaribacter reichenbachii]AUC19612.1 endothelin-converting protein [Polaribacter reichenbachii]OBY63234.1 endothelin-converting protein [Polaribacter reichenbachii]